MWQLWNILKEARFGANEAGQGDTEYMMLLSLAVIVAMFAVVALGGAVYFLWDEIITALPF